MILEELQAEWTKDSKIDQTNLSEETSKVPSLHSKYLNILSSIKKDTINAERNYIRLKRIKTKWYNGELGKDELAHYQWEQYQNKKPLKTELENLLISDEDMMNYKIKLEDLSICQDYVEQVMKSIYTRSYDIKNLLTWISYSNGLS